MVDIEFLRKNCSYCNKWSISVFLKSIANGIWDYFDEANEEEKERDKERGICRPCDYACVSPCHGH